METRYKLIGRGFAGWHATGTSIVGGKACRTDSSGGGWELERYLETAEDGALVYDAAHLEADPATYAAYVTHVVKGPMANPELPAGHIQGVISPAKKWQGEKIRSLDTVALDIFERLLRELPGDVKIGRVKDGKVNWS